MRRSVFLPRSEKKVDPGGVRTVDRGIASSSVCPRADELGCWKAGRGCGRSNLKY